MSEAWSEMAGQIDSILGVDQLAAGLTENAVRVEVRESSFYEGGFYIRVYESAVDFKLERVTGEYLARADADSLEQMHHAASRVSWALAAMEIRHAFEIFDEHTQLICYLHYQWPQQDTS